MEQRRAARFVFVKFDRFSSVTLVISELGRTSLLERGEWVKLKVIFKAYKDFLGVGRKITSRFQEPNHLGRAD